MREGRNLTGAYLLVDSAAVDTLYRTLKNTPSVAGVLLKTAAIESFEATWAEMVAQIRFINMMFAAIIAFGVVYNSARISLTERSRELATLRVIGFTRAEISYILLGELAIITLIAIPFGLALGYVLAAMTVDFYNTEVWRMPLIVSSKTYAFAAVTILVATAFSSLIVRRKLDRLNLVEVLKTKE
jgi:putative ABC transport system permease protein